MQPSPAHKPWQVLQQLVEEEDGQALEQYMRELDSHDTLRAVFRLKPEDQQRLLQLMSPESAAELIEDVPDAHAADMIEVLSASEAASIVSEMASDEQADVLAEMDAGDANLIIEQMDSDAARKARDLIQYRGDSAGGLMMTEYLAYPQTYRAISVLDDLASREQDYALYNVQYLYVISGDGRLTGVLRLRDLIHAASNAQLHEICVAPTTVAPQQGLDELYEFFDAHNMSAVPVVDEQQHLLGVVRGIDVTEALAEKASADQLKAQGIVGGEELRSMPLAVRSRRRLSWLSVNVLLNLLAASVIAFYEDTISAVVALAVFLPIVSDMSGCSGNQAVAVSMRELTLGIVRPVDAFRVWLREASVGLINGIILGALLALAVWLWKGNVYLGMVVGVALALNTVVAVSVGGVVPLLLRGIRVDPAIASGPMLTTITDMFGFFFVLSFATVMLPQLT